MQSIVYAASLACLAAIALFVPGAVSWAALGAVLATAIWLYHSLRDADLERKDTVADLEDGSMINLRDSADVGEHNP
jgi:hypothetical protein